MMPQQEGAFIDRVKLRLKAGDGGKGLISFRHEKYVPLGGPDGGDGGRGGSIILRAHPGLNTLEKLHSRPFYRAENGKPGDINNRSGAGGKDVVLEVPPGTVVKDAETGEVLLDIEETEGDTVLLAGGDGGKGNARFATATNRVPRKATPGFPGEEREVIFELKTVADIGLIGLPNAGKSTLVSAITGAKPRIASYPFTTLQPVLGTITLPEGRGLLVADIPGIIHGAHQGIGLGLDFLRHIERTQMLVYVVEISPHDPEQPGETIQALQAEIRHYDAAILERPYLVALNKVDLLEDEDELRLVLDAFHEQLPEMARERLFVISAQEKRNTEPLRQALVEEYQRLFPAPPLREKPDLFFDQPPAIPEDYSSNPNDAAES